MTFDYNAEKRGTKKLDLKTIGRFLIELHNCYKYISIQKKFKLFNIRCLQKVKLVEEYQNALLRTKKNKRKEKTDSESK